MIKKLTYNELKETCRRQRKVIEGLCQIGTALLGLVEVQTTKIDKLEDLVEKCKLLLHIK